jgi:hypothetical protein
MQSKPWYESITIWGAVMGVLGTVLGFVNIVIAPEAQAQLATAAAQVGGAIAAKDWGAILTGLVSLGGAILAIVGRKQADQPVHFMTPFAAPVPPAKPQG